METFTRKHETKVFGTYFTGYIVIPVGHALHGVAYEKVSAMTGIGLTYSGSVNEAGLYDRFNSKDWLLGIDGINVRNKYDDCGEKWVNDKVKHIYALCDDSQCFLKLLASA